jgi:spore germination protein
VPGTEATAVPPQPTAQTDASGQTIHVVAPGDTLFSISQQYGVSQEAIIAANGLTNPNNLVVGQQLIIPAPGTTPATPVPPTAVPGTEQVYTVRPGDNLFRIGLAYGCTVDQLSAYNNIPAPYTIFVGDQIRIPPDC